MYLNDKKIVLCLISSYTSNLTHISLASFLWDIDKYNSPRCDAAKRGVPSGAILFAYMIFIEKRNKNESLLLIKVGSSKLYGWETPFVTCGLSIPTKISLWYFITGELAVMPFLAWTTRCEVNMRFFIYRYG